MLPTDNTGTRSGTRLTAAPSGWSLTIPSGSNPLYIALATLPSGNTDIDWNSLQRLSPTDGIDGDDGTSLSFAFQRKVGTEPVLPADNTGTRSGGVLTAAPSGWSLTPPSGSDPLYMVIGLLPGSNNDIDWKTIILLSAEDGTDGDTGNSIVQVFQRKTGAAPSLPTDNSGTRTGSTLSAPPAGWSLTDPGGTATLYTAYAILPGSNNDIDWFTLSKISGDNGYSSRFIFRKVNQYDYKSTPTVTYNGTSLSLPSQWSLTPFVSQKFNEWVLPTTTPQDLAIDPDTDIIYILSMTGVNRTNLAGTNTPY